MRNILASSSYLAAVPFVRPLSMRVWEPERHVPRTTSPCAPEPSPSVGSRARVAGREGPRERGTGPGGRTGDLVSPVADQFAKDRVMAIVPPPPASPPPLFLPPPPPPPPGLVCPSQATDKAKTSAADKCGEREDVRALDLPAAVELAIHRLQASGAAPRACAGG